MNSGYIINEIRLTGDGVDNASIQFDSGLNVISGPSDTGKTYVFECINYMLGASKPPKSIKQSRSYKFLFLEISSHNSNIYTLKSDLKGGDLLLFESTIDDITFDHEPEILSRKHNPKSDKTISAFFQKLNNVYGNEIRVNARGKTRQISYRDLVRYFLVSEERIIAKDSIITSHYTKATEDKNVLKFIVTGQDDSDIVALVSKEQISNKKGRLEFINETIDDLINSIDGKTIHHVEEELAELELQISTFKASYADISKELAKYQLRRENLAGDIRQIEYKKKELEELLYRSNFLESQYNSDISRLECTTEASSLLLNSDHEPSKCPVCNSSLTGQCNDKDVQQVIISCEAEISKILNLLRELRKSVSVIKTEISVKEDSLSALYVEANNFDQKINNEIGDRLNMTLNLIEQANAKKNSLLTQQFKKENIKKLEFQKELLEQLIKESRTKGEFESISTANMTGLSNQIEYVLNESNYPNLAAVSFSEEKNDFVISGEDRELFGKGYRAIIYAAFIVSIQELLANKPYSIGVPVIDSPLVTYKRPDYTDEDLIPVDLAQDFYKYLSVSKVDQLIIIENVPPPQKVPGKLNNIVFTRSRSIGRYGFFPN